jgi:tRNA 2-(methylsulfanyl)-N6-isopentenyladenosine37 hydroxylase
MSRSAQLPVERSVGEPSLAELRSFLGAPTPAAWLAAVPANLDLLLIDHAHCEKKAAASALSLIHRHPERRRLVQRMSRLAREELRHFEQVLERLDARGLVFREIGSPRYASTLHAACRTDAPARLVDQLIIGGFIEARSCERFAAMVPVLEQLGESDLARFYGGLLAAEARHFKHYLEHAQELSAAPLDDRIATLRAVEADLILTPEPEFRFHSGPPG